jgi:hypothetical protein
MEGRRRCGPWRDGDAGHGGAARRGKVGAEIGATRPRGEGRRETGSVACRRWSRVGAAERVEAWSCRDEGQNGKLQMFRNVILFDRETENVLHFCTEGVHGC